MKTCTTDNINTQQKGRRYEGALKIRKKNKNDLLLNSDRGAGGAVVSKGNAAVGRKGGGGAWGLTSRNAGLAGPAPQNGRWSNTGKKQAKMSIAGLPVAIWWC
jgi:hypothetical protein